MTSQKAPRTVGVLEALEPRRLMSALFVSASAGSDDNPGTLAAPFRSIQKAADLARPGDVVYIRGGTYRETVRPANSGTESARITFAAYENERVTVSGADVLSGWSTHNNSIFKTQQDWTLGRDRDQVFVDGRMMIEARWPNTAVANFATPSRATADYVTAAVDGDNSTASLTDSDLRAFPAGSLNGATIQILAGAAWTAWAGVVTSSAEPGKLAFNYNQRPIPEVYKYETPETGDRYFISGAFVALDAPGEWYRDPNDGKLYLWTAASDNPAGHVVEAKRRQYAFDLRDRSYVNVDGIGVFAASISTSEASSDVVLSRLDAKYVSHFVGRRQPWGLRGAPDDSGIQLRGSRSFIRDSVITYSAGDGVFLGGSDNRAVNNVIRYADYGAADNAGVSVIGPGHVVSRNTISHTGRSGILHSYSPRAVITHNHIHDVMLQTTDGGGTYTWGTDGEGTVIAYNKVHAAHSGGFGTAGIYLDNNSVNHVVHHNLVYDADFGVKLNPANTNALIYNNTFAPGMQLSVASSGSREMSGTVFANNIFGSAGVQTGPGATTRNNLWPGGDYKFVDAASRDYRLQVGSPAVDRGAQLPPYTDGFSGSAPDVGAFELNQPAWTAGSTLAEAPAPEPPEPPQPPVRNWDARVTIEAERFNAMQGVKLTTAGDAVGYADAGDWIKFTAVDFGANPPLATLNVRLALPASQAGGKIEVRTGGPAGALHGTLTTASTGSWTAYATQSAAVTGLSGVKDLYLVFRGRSGVANVDSFRFAESNTPTPTPTRDARGTIQAETFDAMQGVLKRDYGVGSTSSGDWVKYAGVDFGTGVSTFKAHVALPNANAGRRIEVRVGAPNGTLAGTLTTTGTGAWTTFVTQSAAVSGLTGVKDVYLVFQGGEGVANVDWFTFA